MKRGYFSAEELQDSEYKKKFKGFSTWSLKNLKNTLPTVEYNPAAMLLQDARDRNDNVDVILKAGLSPGYEVGVHRLIFEKSSEFFHRMLATQMKEGMEGIVTLNLDARQLRIVQEFVYIGVGDLARASDGEMLWQMADYCNFKAMHKALEGTISLDNVFFIMSLDLQGLNLACLDFIAARFTSHLGKTFSVKQWRGVPQDLALQAIQVTQRYDKEGVKFTKQRRLCSAGIEMAEKYLSANRLSTWTACDPLLLFEVNVLEKAFVDTCAPGKNPRPEPLQP
jgi:hypothetical protein